MYWTLAVIFGYCGQCVTFDRGTKVGREQGWGLIGLFLLVVITETTRDFESVPSVPAEACQSLPKPAKAC